MEGRASRGLAPRKRGPPPATERADTPGGCLDAGAPRSDELGCAEALLVREAPANPPREELAMKECLKFYINGEWVAPVTPKTMDVINPATEEPIGRISLGSAADVDKAVAAARAAFETFGRTSREERIALLERVIAAYASRLDEIAETISLEMGAPMWLAKAAQAPAGLAHFMQALEVLK